MPLLVSSYISRLNNSGSWARIPEILVGHSSHLLLAGADSSQQAYEDPAKGGKFTQFLLEALEEAGESGDLQTMTYQRLVGKIQDKFRAIVDPTGTSEHQTL